MAKKRMIERRNPVFQFRPHPWHGLEVGPEPPNVLNAYIEITPYDLMTYEVEIIVRCRVIGGLQMIDRGEADDKIIAVLDGDYVWGEARGLSDVPPVLIERLQHYFATYKMVPGEVGKVKVDRIYERDHALKVVMAAMADYADAFRA